MNVWKDDHPSEPGYYWIKRAVTGSKDIVYLTKEMLVLEVGSRKPISSYYDIQAWGSKVEEPAD